MPEAHGIRPADRQQLSYPEPDGGISVNDTTLGTTVANLGWDEVRFPKPLFHGDTVHIQTEVLELRESRSRPDNGIVIFEHRAYNQDNDWSAAVSARR